MMIDWTRANLADIRAINRVVRAASNVMPELDMLATQMDLEACHTHGCRLDLDRMAEARDYDPIHDVAGIARHLDRETGELRDCFVPRFAAAD